MQQGRVSSIRFNEWICVSAQHERAVARLGRQIYQGYSRGLVTDFASIEICKEISQAFADSKQVRAEMEEELERDALHGLSAEEAALAEDILELTTAQKVMRQLKLRATKMMGRQAVNRSLQSYRDRVRDLSRDLGLRALALHTKEPILKIEGHLRLCHLAVKLDEDANKKWEEIVKGKNDKGGMDLSFHTILISFVANFANFSRNTALGKMLLKLFRYDPKEEEEKLTKQYEGTTTAKALQAQMAEVDEPDLDIGREMASMEKDYAETPQDWGLPARSATDTWAPDTDSAWSPPTLDELVAAPAPSAPTQRPAAVETTPVADGPKPQVMRQRPPAPEVKSAQDWVESGSEKKAQPEPEPEPWIAPASNGPRIGQAAPQESTPEEGDWAFEEEDEPATHVTSRPALGHMAPPPAAPAESRFELPPTSPGAPPSQPPAAWEPPAIPSTPSVWEPPAKPTTQSVWEPPSLPSSGGSTWEPPALPSAPATHASSTPSLPPLPPLPARSIRSLDGPASPPPFVPAAPSPTPPSGPTFAPVPAPSDDPLLRLLRPDTGPDPVDDDDLLPAFLRERKDDDASLDSSFIPELPDGDLGLKILPFGNTPDKKKDEEEPDSFIPKMPDL